MRHDRQGRDQRFRPHRPQHLRAIVESGRKDIEVVAINDLGPVETNAHLLRFDSVHGRFPHEVTVEGDHRRRPDKIKVTAIKDPARAAAQGTRRRHRARMHRHLHLQGQGLGASDRRRQARHRLGARRRRRPDRGLRRQPRQADQGPHRHLECVLHHQLPGARRQGPQQRGRHREGLHDHDPFLYRRPADARHDAQGSLPRPRGGPVDDPDLDRRRQGRRPRAAGTQGQARRRFDPRADPERLVSTSSSWPSGTSPSKEVNARSSPQPTARSRASSAYTNSRTSRSTSTTTRLVDLPLDQTKVIDGNVRARHVLVRQRMGLLEPHGDTAVVMGRTIG
jgi:hypothetical protein